MLETRYRDLLKEELAVRCERNQKYSLRAFARDLEVDPAALSRVLNGKQDFSYSSARIIADRLFNSSRRKELFLNLFEYSATKSEKTRRNLLVKIQSLAKQEPSISLSLDTFKVISDWYHIAIADMTQLKRFDPRPQRIAAALGISLAEAKSATERLLKVGILRTTAVGKLEKTSATLKTPTRVSSEHLRKFHRSMIQKALASLDGQDHLRRTITGVTLPLSENNIEQINGLIEEFKKSVLALSENTEPKEKLYQLNIQFFDLLTQEEK